MNQRGIYDNNHNGYLFSANPTSSSMRLTKISIFTVLLKYTHTHTLYTHTHTQQHALMHASMVHTHTCFNWTQLAMEGLVLVGA